MKRREFLTIPAGALGGTLLYTLAGEPMRLAAQSTQKAGTVRVPLRFFTEQEARVVAAASERIFPSDASGPGAKEAGVAIYIDRQLAGPYGKDKYRYTKGPWRETVSGARLSRPGESSRYLSQRNSRSWRRFRGTIGGRAKQKISGHREDALLRLAARAHD